MLNTSTAPSDPFAERRLARSGGTTADGREIILAESRALERLVERLDADFCRVVSILLACRGSTIVTGMEKRA